LPIGKILYYSTGAHLWIFKKIGYMETVGVFGGI